MAAIRYVEKNPVRAGIVKKAWKWKWSSAAAHIGKTNSMIHLENITNLVDVSTKSWKQYLNSNENEEDINDIRNHTLLGFPLGTTSSDAKPDKKVGRLISVLSKDKLKKRAVRLLGALSRGRPKKRTVKKSKVSTRSRPKKRTVKKSKVSPRSRRKKQTVKKSKVLPRSRRKKRSGRK
jgi:hypothetical protein